MRTRVIATSCAAAVLSVTVAASGQATSRPPTAAPVENGSQQPGAAGSTATDPHPGATSAGARTDTNQRPGTQPEGTAPTERVTLTGCVERDAANHLVLVVGTADDHTSGEPTPRPPARFNPSTTGTLPPTTTTTVESSTAGAHNVRNYRLSGQDLSGYLHRRVEVTARMPTIEPTASAPLRGDNRSSVDETAVSRENNGSVPGGGVTSSSARSQADDGGADVTTPSGDRDGSGAADRAGSGAAAITGAAATSGTTGPTQRGGTTVSAARAGSAETIVVTDVKGSGGATCR